MDYMQELRQRLSGLPKEKILDSIHFVALRDQVEWTLAWQKGETWVKFGQE